MIDWTDRVKKDPRFKHLGALEVSRSLYVASARRFANHRVLAAVVILFAGCASAPPSPPPPPPGTFEAGPGPYQFDCNAPGGRYSERNVHAPVGMFSVKGVVRFESFGGNPTWAPMAAVELAGANEDSIAGIAAIAGPGLVQVGIRNTLGRGRGGPDVFARIRIPFTGATEMAFDMVLEKPGQLLVTVGESKRTVFFSRSAAITRIRMVCSTAHAQFLNLAVSD